MSSLNSPTYFIHLQCKCRWEGICVEDWWGTWWGK